MATKRKPQKTAEQRCQEASHLETRLAKTDCRRCTRPIWSGTVKGEPTRMDRINLSTAGEYAALLAGLKTYQRNVLGSNVFRRRGSHINAGLPLYAHINGEHRCDWHWAATHFDVREIFPRPRGNRAPF